MRCEEKNLMFLQKEFWKREQRKEKVIIKKKTRKIFPDLKDTSLQIESIPLSIQLDGWNKDSPLDISSFSFKTLKIKRNKNKEGLTTTYRE